MAQEPNAMVANQEGRAKRTTKKPAWMNDNVDPSQLVTGEAKAPRQAHKKSSHERSAASQQDGQQRWSGRADLPRRMCLNPGCKSPFESPQWRRGPLGPGTLCNACGTRYARIEAKRRGERKGGAKLRPQDLADWQAFEQQLHNPISARDAWQAYAEHHRARGAAAVAAAASAAAAATAGQTRLGPQQLQELLAQAAAVEQQDDEQQQQQQQYDDEYEDAYEDDGVEGEYQHTEGARFQQQAGHGGDAVELLCQEGMPDSDSPGDKATASRTAAAAGAPAPALSAAAVGRSALLTAAGAPLLWSGLQCLLHPAAPVSQPQLLQQQEAGGSLELASGSPKERHSPLLEFGPALRPSRRRPRRCDDEAGGSDSQEAAACSYQELPGCVSSSAASTGARGAAAAAAAAGGVGGETWVPGGAGGGGEQFLHLLAVGEAMIKAEGVAQEDRREAWSEYVEKQLPAEQRREADSSQGMKRSRFGLEAGAEQLVGRAECASAAAGEDGQQQQQQQQRQPGQPQRAKPTAAEQPVPPERFERLLAEAEQCIRARSASPCMRGAPAASPLRRPATPAAGGLTTAAAAAAARGAAPSAASRTGTAAASAGSSSLVGTSGPAAVGHAVAAARDAAAAAGAAAAPAGPAAGGEGSDAWPSEQRPASTSAQGAATDKSPLVQQADDGGKQACPSPLVLPAAAVGGLAADAAGSACFVPHLGAQ